MHNAIAEFLEPREGLYVQWYETHPQSFMLRLTPLDIAEHFHAQMALRPGAWIFTSATLSVGNEFRHFLERMGIDADRTLRLDSPFDYAENALLYVPKGLPEPNSSQYPGAFLDAALPVLAASRGRAFVLFTSHRALQIAAEFLAERIDYPLLVQGTAGQHLLLSRFREMGNAVLLGTASFWEGVDVRGEALSCVIIDRLPFASPADPVVQATIEAMRRAAGNPFAEYQLPQAVIALRQGVGRLIRDSDDRGVLMIGDGRLLSKSYGRMFLKSLPPMPLTTDLGDVRRFFGETAPARVTES